MIIIKKYYNMFIIITSLLTVVYLIWDLEHRTQIDDFLSNFVFLYLMILYQYYNIEYIVDKKIIYRLSASLLVIFIFYMISGVVFINILTLKGLVCSAHVFCPVIGFSLVRMPKDPFALIYAVIFSTFILSVGIYFSQKILLRLPFRFSRLILHALPVMAFGLIFYAVGALLYFDREIVVFSDKVIFCLLSCVFAFTHIRWCRMQIFVQPMRENKT